MFFDLQWQNVIDIRGRPDSAAFRCGIPLVLKPARRYDADGRELRVTRYRFAVVVTVIALTRGDICANSLLCGVQGSQAEIHEDLFVGRIYGLGQLGVCHGGSGHGEGTGGG